jgi:hypothetical protein
MGTDDIEPQTFKLQRGFKWIGPFFAVLIPLAIWAFFIDDSEPPNAQGGMLAIGILTFFAVLSHLTATRTSVTVSDDGLEVGGLLGVRSALWSDVRYATIERGDVILHLTSGKPLRVSGYVERIDWFISLVEARGLFREAAA